LISLIWSTFGEDECIYKQLHEDETNLTKEKNLINLGFEEFLEQT
jgi:hypothetical protein